MVGRRTGAAARTAVRSGRSRSRPRSRASPCIRACGDARCLPCRGIPAASGRKCRSGARSRAPSLRRSATGRLVRRSAMGRLVPLLALRQAAAWWSVRQVEVHDLVSLGRALAELEVERYSCGIRGEPLPGIDLACSRRLKDKAEDGTPSSFTTAARCWFGIDFDSLPAPVWDPERLARRRVGIERDRAEYGQTPPRARTTARTSTWPTMRIRRRLTRRGTGQSSSAPPSLPCRSSFTTPQPTGS
jgi:hypothetical protein